MHAAVLIAGAGDVGMRVASRFAALGHPVFALRRHPPGAAPPGVTWVRGDLTDPGSLAALPKVATVVYAPTPAARDEAAYRAIFPDGLRHLVEALPAAPARTVFASSTAVYGEHGGDWVDEDTPPDPPGFNGRILLEAEHWLGTASVGGVSVRLAGLYGPGRTQLLDRLREGKAAVPRGQGVYANRIHVDDAAAALVHVARLADPAPVYLGVDDTPLPIDVLYGDLATLVGSPPPPDGPPPAGVGNKRLSNARLRASGFRCTWPDAREGYAALV
ncbi:NAD-dependent epimerase/dehydratase family protein [Luteibacter aegosomatissinici]|nr:NAD-dependent epimerase/dehydratase family protein [Luteibacter aegosomatissinici]UPG96671.1 NAD-dependent epimerase/dehydratase family protein [Luteibacter aegosomatissinici]